MSPVSAMFDHLDISNLQSSAKQLRDCGLFTGKCGIALAVNGLLKAGDNSFSQSFADSLLLDVMNETKSIQYLNIHSGICGIGLALQYMSMKEYVGGDIDYALADIDNRAYKESCIRDNGIDINSLLELLYYFSMRLRFGLKVKDRPLYISLSRYLMNRAYYLLDLKTFCENRPYNIFYAPFLFTLSLSNFVSCGLFSERIAHIMNEYSCVLRGHLPVHMLGRISLALSLEEMKASGFILQSMDEIIHSLTIDIDFLQYGVWNGK